MTRAAPAPERRATGDLRRNRRGWEHAKGAYERRHARALRVAGGASWGLYRVPESELRLLGDVRGRRTLELGCGSATWSLALARRGAHPVAIDFSRGRIRQAADNLGAARRQVHLAEANAERLPFRAGRFDLAFCDWGALTFARPERIVPEAARVLRDGGRLVFATSSPFRLVAQSPRRALVGPTLRRRYFDLGRIAYPEGVEHHRSYAGWIRLFRQSGFTVERLEELPAPPGRGSSYLSPREAAWARRWPMESIWALRKSPGSEDRPGRRPRPGAGSAT